MLVPVVLNIDLPVPKPGAVFALLADALQAAAEEFREGEGLRSDGLLDIADDVRLGYSVDWDFAEAFTEEDEEELKF